MKPSTLSLEVSWALPCWSNVEYYARARNHRLDSYLWHLCNEALSTQVH